MELEHNSSCVDRGDDQRALHTDIDGNQRFNTPGVGSGVTLTDLGAYESGGVACAPFAVYATHLYEVGCHNDNAADAENYCRSLGNDLVSLTAPEENTAVRSMLPDGFNVWIGARREPDGWTWPTAEPFIYNNWNDRSGEPNGTGDGAELREPNGYWFDEDCTMAQPSVCEWRQIAHSLI